MKQLLIATLALCLPANAALSLSCLRPDVIRSYHQAADADDAYMVVSGILAHQVDQAPEDRSDKTPPFSFTAQLVGKYLRDDGLTGDFAAPVDVTLNCVSAWCATLPPQRSSVLAFVQVTEDGLRIDAQACPLWLFDEPEPEQMVGLVMCHTEGDCPGE